MKPRTGNFQTRPSLANAIQEFLALESAGGIVLVIAAVLAMLIANSPASGLYEHFLALPLRVSIGEFEIAKPSLLWINDGLMAIFFFLVGLEIKRETLQGELSDPRQIVLPLAAAVGGMAFPALLYTGINWGEPIAMRGWAIPTATDIAFALGVLSLLGNRIPNSLKLFLLTLAIIDDLGAIVVIALFYSGTPSFSALAMAGIAYAALLALNLGGVRRISPYLLLGAVLWVAVLKSGVHATIAGVLLAFTVPLRGKYDGQAPLVRLEHDLHSPVAFAILPLFAFANAGITFAGMRLDMLWHPVPLGIALGLFLGKQIGVFGVSWLFVRLRWARLPEGVNWASLYGVSLLCGIGFTMSLFVSSLAFHESPQGGAVPLPVDERIGVILGSVLSALLGYTVLRMQRVQQPSSAP